MRITKEEYRILWGISYLGEYDPKTTSNGTLEGIKKHTKLFLRLEKLGLIKIEARKDDPIYGACMTKAGVIVVEDKKYEKWNPELT